MSLTSYFDVKYWY